MVAKPELTTPEGLRMMKVVEHVAENALKDPLAIPEKRALIDNIIEENKHIPGATMVVLNELQSQIGFISEPMQAHVAKKLKVPVGSVHGVVTFYSFFTTKPRGRHTLKFCMGTACYVGGIPQLIDKAKQILGINVGDTTPDGMVTLEVCRCVGACSQAPVVLVDETSYGRVRPNKLPQIIKKAQTEE
jgi:NADH-quinone oxidoreductase subunit E